MQYRFRFRRCWTKPKPSVRIPRIATLSSAAGVRRLTKCATERGRTGWTQQEASATERDAWLPHFDSPSIFRHRDAGRFRHGPVRPPRRGSRAGDRASRLPVRRRGAWDILCILPPQAAGVEVSREPREEA
jgi:hypothetical protein